MFCGRALARAAIASSAAMTAATAFAFLACLHRWPRFTRLLIGARLARRLIGTRLTRFPRFPRLAGRAGLLLVAALLVHIAPGALAIAARPFVALAFGPRFTRRTISAGRT